MTGAATPTNTPRTFASKLYVEQPFALHGLEGISDAQIQEHYFANLCSAAEPKPADGSAVATALADSFGSVEQWMAAFQAIGATRGVGWVILFQDPATRWLTNHWITLHHEGVPVGFRPLLVMDVWEHAFVTRSGLKPTGTPSWCRVIQ